MVGHAPCASPRRSAVLGWAWLGCALLLSLQGGCKTQDACESMNDCIAADASGFSLLWQCLEGVCTTTPCESSADCELEAHCQALPSESEEIEPETVCAEGCLQDNDCPAGTFCREGVCEDQPCRNGHLDCELGEICENGTCVDAGFPYCEQCMPSLNEYDIGDPNFSCDTTLIGHPFCGAGNFCWSLPGGPTCGVPCTSNSDCPGGFSCGQALMEVSVCDPEFISLGKFCVSDVCFN